MLFFLLSLRKAHGVSFDHQPPSIMLILQNLISGEVKFTSHFWYTHKHTHADWSCLKFVNIYPNWELYANSAI